MEIQIENTTTKSLEQFDFASINRTRVVVKDGCESMVEGAIAALSITSERDCAFQCFMGNAVGIGEVEQSAQAPYFDDECLGPFYPSTGTQSARLLAALLIGKEIDPLAGWLTLGIYRLSDTVFRLRNLGWPVITARLNVKNRFGEECYVANYYLALEAIVEAGDRGREFSMAALARKEAA